MTPQDPADTSGDPRRSPWRRRLKRAGLTALVGVTALVVSGVVYYFATLYQAGSPQRGYLALTGATALLGEDLRPVENATVLVRDGEIVDAGLRAEVDVPGDATVLNLDGHTLLPGLIDLHVHFGTPDSGSTGPLAMPLLFADLMRYVPDRRRALLDHGVTSVRSLGDEHEWIMDMRRQLRDGTLEGPRLFAAGPIFTTAGGHPVVTFGGDPESDFVRLPTTPTQARHMVRQLAGGDDAVDLIKIVQERGTPARPLEPLPPQVLDAIVDEAHAQELPVTVHWGTTKDLRDALAAGADGLQHIEARGLRDGWPPEMLERLVERDVSLTPTLAVTDAADGVDPDLHGRLRQRVREFHGAGGQVLAGSDAPMQGLDFGASLHRELELLVDSGLTTREALRGATSDAARVLGTDDVGAIMGGRAADLVAVAGDPLEDITDLREPRLVLRDGRVVTDHREDD